MPFKFKKNQKFQEMIDVRLLEKNTKIVVDPYHKYNRDMSKTPKIDKAEIIKILLLKNLLLT